jgi:hypothetical protein
MFDEGKMAPRAIGSAVLAVVSLLALPTASGQGLAVARPAILGAAAFGTPAECQPPAPDLLARVAATRLVCPLSTQGPVMASYELQGESLLVAFDARGAVVGLTDGASTGSLAFAGRVERTGSAADTVHWGLWREGQLLHGSGTDRAEPRRIDDTSAIPYVVGVPSTAVHRTDLLAGRSRRMSALPESGIASYRLAGEAGVVSERDTDGGVVPLGSVQSARATVDFGAGTVRVEFRSAVRSTAATLELELAPRDSIGGGVELQRSCDGECPTVEGRFYGRDGEYLGITFRYRHHEHLPEPAAVAARLMNVHAQGAFVLQRER